MVARSQSGYRSIAPSERLTAGVCGRPDLTIFAPGAVATAKVSWIALEAKGERGVCREEDRRADLFAEKSKYITAGTAWFVMDDPATIVARRVDHGRNAASDIVLDLTILLVLN